MLFKQSNNSRARVISVLLLILFLFQACNLLILQAENDSEKYIYTYAENHIADYGIVDEAADTADTSITDTNSEGNNNVNANEIIVVYKEEVAI